MWCTHDGSVRYYNTLDAMCEFDWADMPHGHYGVVFWNTTYGYSAEAIEGHNGSQLQRLLNGRFDDGRRWLIEPCRQAPLQSTAMPPRHRLVWFGPKTSKG
ncbi:hypothetical protein IID04_04760 [PVC group bacterium]|nr:hypothetical protein [PVC group bacterium]